MQSSILTEKKVSLLKRTIEHLRNRNKNKSSDTTKENVVEKIQIGYIINIFREAINKLKILFKLPAIVENEPELLATYLEATEVEQILQLFRSEQFGAANEANYEESIERITDLYFNEDDPIVEDAEKEEEEAEVVDFHFGDFDPVNLSRKFILQVESSTTPPPEDEVDKTSSVHDSLKLKQISYASNNEQNQSVSGSRTKLVDKKKSVPSKAHITQCLDFVLHSKGLIDVLKDGARYKIEEDSAEAKLISAVEALLVMVSQNLNISWKDDLINEKETRRAYQFGFVLDDNIAALEQYNSKRQQEYSNQQKEKADMICDIRQKIDELRINQIDKKFKTLAEMDSDIKSIIVSSELRQQDYAVEVEHSIQLYESLLQSNLKEEQLMKSKLMKVQTQVAAWITKYDTDFAERQEQLDKLEEHNAELKDEVMEIEDLLDDQEDQYLVLMAEKAEEERIIFEEILLNFVRNRSARIIQRAWKAYKARKLARKLARKKRGKAKAGSMSGQAKPKKDKKKKEKKVREVAEKKIKDPPPKTLEQKFGDDMFKDLADADSSAFQNKPTPDLS